MLRRVDPWSAGLSPLGEAGIDLRAIADIVTPMSILPVGQLVIAGDDFDAGNDHPGLNKRSVRRRVIRC